MRIKLTLKLIMLLRRPSSILFMMTPGLSLCFTVLETKTFDSIEIKQQTYLKPFIKKLIIKMFKLLFSTFVCQMAQSKLIIQSPKALKDLFPDGIVKASYANFGLIPYGHTMVSLILIQTKKHRLARLTMMRKLTPYVILLLR